MKKELKYLPIAHELTETQKENTIKLIEALRSGKYKQTKELLKIKRYDGEICYCCLGVGSEILGTESEIDSESNEYYFVYNHIRANNLPSIDWWIEHYGWSYSTNPEPLSGLNDSGTTFEEIANLIESIVIHKKPFTLFRH